MGMQEYEEVKGLRVSEIVALATRDLEGVIKYFSKKEATTEAMRMGTLAHSILLRKDRDYVPDDIIIIQAENYLTKQAREHRNRAFEDGLLPVLRKDYEYMFNGLGSVENILNKYFDPDKCEFEKPYYATDERFGKIKGRIDAVYDGRIVNDLKVSSVPANQLDKKIWDMGYQLQMYIYMELSGLEEANLVFVSPDTFLVSVKHLQKDIIQDECVVLLQKALENWDLLHKYQDGMLGEYVSSEYQAPQWAYSILMDEESQEQGE